MQQGCGCAGNVGGDITKQVITTVAHTKGAVLKYTDSEATTIHKAHQISQFGGSNS